MGALLAWVAVQGPRRRFRQPRGVQARKPGNAEHAYRDVFELGLPAFGRARAAGAGPTRAMQAVFLEFLAALPDSHIVRRHGGQVAQSVIREALPWRARARNGDPLETDPAFALWDEDLKARGLNPGTSADLCVAVALVAALRRFP